MTSFLKKASNFFLGEKKRKEEKEKYKKGNQEGSTQQINDLRDGTRQKIMGDNEEDQKETSEENKYRNLGKLFVGGLSYSTNSKGLEEYFSRFGAVVDSVVMRHPESKKSRGFGFVTFADPANCKTCLEVENHILDGKKIDLRPFSSRESGKIIKNMNSRLFLGGLPFNLLQEDIKRFFERYGQIEDILIPVDKNTKKLKGYGFLSFKDETAAKKCLAERFVYLNGRRVQIKKAVTRGCSKGEDKMSTCNDTDICEGEEINESFTDQFQSSSSQEIDDEIQSVTSGEGFAISELKPEIQKIFDEYFLSKFEAFNAMNGKKINDGNKEDGFNDTEVTEIEKLLADFLMNSSEQIGAFKRDLIEFSSESEMEYSNSDAQEDTSDEEEIDECSTPGSTVAGSIQNTLEELKAEITKISLSERTLSDQDICRSKSSAPKSSNFSVFQQSTVPLKIKDSEGTLVCSLCEWTPPDNSSESFLAHCKTLAHRKKLRERFLISNKNEDYKLEKELFQSNRPLQKEDLKLKSFSDKSSAESQQTISKNQSNNNQKCNEAKQKHQRQPSQQESENLIQKKKPKSEAGNKKNQKNEGETKEKAQESTVLKINALAKGIACIQPISESEIICKMCSKIIPKALDFNTLMKNVSHHLQSKGHLKKLLEADNSTNQIAVKQRKTKAKKKNSGVGVKEREKKIKAKKKEVVAEERKSSKIEGVHKSDVPLLKEQKCSDKKKISEIKDCAPKSAETVTQKGKTGKKKLENTKPSKDYFLCLSCNLPCQSFELLKVHVNSKSHLNCPNNKNVNSAFSLSNMGKCKGCENWLYGSLYDINKHHSKCLELKK